MCNVGIMRDDGVECEQADHHDGSMGEKAKKTLGERLDEAVSYCSEHDEPLTGFLQDALAKHAYRKRQGVIISAGAILAIKDGALEDLMRLELTDGQVFLGVCEKDFKTKYQPRLANR